MSLSLRVVLLVMVVSLSAHAAEAPVLTDVQTLKLQNAILRVQLTEARVRSAQIEFEQARQAANVLIHGLQQPGYALDLDRLVYVPKPPEAEPKP